MRNTTHAVWDVYDEYRTARYYAKVLSLRLERYRSLQKGLEIALVVFAPTSAISSIFFFDAPIGRIILQTLTSLVAIIAAVKPIMKIDQEIEGLRELLMGYRMLGQELSDLCTSISQRRGYDDKMKDRFLEIIKMKREFVKSTVNFNLTRSDRESVFEDVNRELPPENFYIPEE